MTASVDYLAYLDSDQWAYLRQLVLEHAAQRAGGWAHACEACHAARPTEVHHLTYARLGREDLADLVALCHECHQPGLYVDIRLPDTRWADDPDHAFRLMFAEEEIHMTTPTDRLLEHLRAAWRAAQDVGDQEAAEVLAQLGRDVKARQA